MFYTRYSHTICEHGVPVFPCDIVTKATFKKLGQTLSGSIVVNLLTNFKDDSGMTLEHQVENESQVRPENTANELCNRHYLLLDSRKS